MYRIIELNNKEKRELFTETAVRIGATPSIIEKDFWVVWVLDKLFKDERLNKILMFKGGTSLSKVFNQIGRFSEDIDLLKQVVDFKLKFYPATWTRLEEAKPGTIKLTPSKIHINDLKKDYKAMENMIFDKKLTFEEILKTLKNLENEINTSDK